MEKDFSHSNCINQIPAQIANESRLYALTLRSHNTYLAFYRSIFGANTRGLLVIFTLSGCAFTNPQAYFYN
jgi:hypothetical protein